MLTYISKPLALETTYLTTLVFGTQQGIFRNNVQNKAPIQRAHHFGVILAMYN
jgi:hypothetical protein